MSWCCHFQPFSDWSKQHHLWGGSGVWLARGRGISFEVFENCVFSWQSCWAQIMVRILIRYWGMRVSHGQAHANWLSHISVSSCQARLNLGQCCQVPWKISYCFNSVGARKWRLSPTATRISNAWACELSSHWRSPRPSLICQRTSA